MERGPEAERAADAVARVSVHTLGGRTIDLDVILAEPLFSFLSDLAGALGVAPLRQRLLFADGSELPEVHDMPAAAAGLADGSSLTLVFVEPTPVPGVLSDVDCQQLIEVGRSIAEVASTDVGGYGFYAHETPRGQGCVDRLQASLGVLNMDEVRGGGGSAHIAKMLLSKSEDAVAVVAFVPAHMLRQVTAVTWIQAVLETWGAYSNADVWRTSYGTDASVLVSREAFTGTQFGAGIVQEGIAVAVQFLRSQDLIQDDDDEDVCYGGDDLWND